MKKVMIMLCCALMGIAAKAQENKQVISTTTSPATDKDAGKFQFKEETYDYGEVPEGPFAECDFVFKNTGKKPIVITNAHGSCGCTVPEWSHEPVMPGSKGNIHVKYTTAGHAGQINKDITIISNAQQSPMVLHIKGSVIPKPVEVSQSSGAIIDK